MCGRINVSDNEGVRLLLAMLGMEVWPSRDPRFNVAPSQRLDVVSWANNEPAHQAMTWGLVPSWAKPGTFKSPLINARSETVHEKPSFRHLVKSNRALIPINGFYEWKRSGKTKIPYFVKPVDSHAMLIAAIYQPANDTSQTDAASKSEERSQVCVVTVEANDTMAEVHHRMPVILSPKDALTWIQPSDTPAITELMRPASNDAVELIEVGNYVNSARNEGPECIEPSHGQDLFGSVT